MTYSFRDHYRVDRPLHPVYCKRSTSGQMEWAALWNLWDTGKGYTVGKHTDREYLSDMYMYVLTSKQQQKDMAVTRYCMTRHACTIHTMHICFYTVMYFYYSIASYKSSRDIKKIDYIFPSLLLHSMV